MPLSYCARYYSLRAKVESEGLAARAAGLNPHEAQGWHDALSQLRAHAEVCDDCIGALFGAFPETEGKTRTMVEVKHG